MLEFLRNKCTRCRWKVHCAQSQTHRAFVSRAHLRCGSRHTRPLSPAWRPSSPSSAAACRHAPTRVAARYVSARAHMLSHSCALTRWRVCTPPTHARRIRVHARPRAPSRCPLQLIALLLRTAGRAVLHRALWRQDGVCARAARAARFPAALTARRTGARTHCARA